MNPEEFNQLIQRIRANDPSMTSMDLRYNNIGAEGAREIAKVLGVNNTITSVDLGGNNIGDEGARAITEALKVNKTITSLDLKLSNMGDAGAVAIAEALKVNESLTSVSLNRNNIRYEGARAIAEAIEANKTITSLDVDGNRIEIHLHRQIWILIEIRNTEFLKDSVEKLKRGEVLDQDAYQTLAAHIDKSKNPDEPNEHGYSQNDFTRYIEKMHREVSMRVDLKHKPAMDTALTDPFIAATIREFLDVKSIANLQQAMRGNLLPLLRGLSDVAKTLRESPNLKTQIRELDPKTRSNLIKNANKAYLNKLAEEGKAWSIAKIIRHFPEESRRDLGGIVRKLYENPIFIENPKNRKLLADQIKENQKKLRGPKHER